MTSRKPTNRQSRAIRRKGIAVKDNRGVSRIDADGAVCSMQPKFHLIKTPGPAIDESPAGYALRLANENGFRGLAKLKMAAGIDSGYVITLGWQFARLNDILGENKLPPNFGYCREQNARGKVWVLGNAVTSEHLGFERARICPRCLAELGYVPIAWDLRACVACVRHRCMMLKYCNDCGRRIRVNRFNLFNCNCGSDLRLAKTPLATDELLALMSVLHAKLGGNERMPLLARALGFPIDGLLTMDLDVLCKCLVQLTKVMLRLNLGYWPYGRSVKVAENLINTSKLFADWPHNFKSLCSSWQTHCEIKPSCDEEKAYVFQKAFAWLFVRLYKNLRNKSNQTLFLAHAALQHGMEAWEKFPIGLRGSALANLDLPQPRYLSVAQAARLLHMRPFALSLFIEKGDFRCHQVVCGRHRKRFVIDVRYLENLRLSRNLALSSPKAAKLLGISHPTYEILKKEGDIQCTYKTLGNGCVSVEDIVEFRASIVRRAHVAPIQTRLHSVAKFLNGRSPVQLKVSILRRIRDGHIETFYRRRRSTLKDIWSKQILFDQ